MSDISKQRIRIKCRAYDHKLLDSSSADIVRVLQMDNVKIHGPIPIPTKIRKYTVLRSPHVDKKSREQFEMREHKRIIDIIDPVPSTVDSLRKLRLPLGVEIELEL